MTAVKYGLNYSLSGGYSDRWLKRDLPLLPSSPTPSVELQELVSLKPVYSIPIFQWSVAGKKKHVDL